jgi:hypothetical protein
MEAADVPRILAQFRAEQAAAEQLIAAGIDLDDRAAVATTLQGLGYDDQPDQQQYFIGRTVECAQHLRKRAIKVASLVEGAAAKRAKRTRRGGNEPCSNGQF